MNIGRKLTSLICGLAAVAVTVPHAAAEPVPPFIPADAPWLTVVNYQRAMAGLAPVTEEPSFSDGAQKHSCYMLLNGMSHDEIPGRPGYTPEGDAAGNNGNVAVSSAFGTSARSHIELWMTGPFHAIGVLRPNLQRVGFGKCDNEATSPWRSAATLDVLRGLGPRQPMSAPILWPGNGTTTSLDRFVAESPDPRSFCGWQGGGGLPVIALMPEAVNAVSGSMTGPNGPLEVCTLSRLNTSGVAQSIMAGDNAVVVMPRWRLDPGTYSVQVTTQARTVNWSFTIDPAAKDAPLTPPPTATPIGDTKQYTPVQPARVVDTRINLALTPLVGGIARRVQIAGSGGVPADATAVNANFTIASPWGAGFLTTWNCATPRPTASTLNYRFLETVANGAIVPLDSGGGLCVWSSQIAHLVVDVYGHYSPSGTSGFVGLSPQRLADTRIGLGLGTRLPAGATRTLQVAGSGGVPTDADAAVLNITSIFPSQNGFITAYPCGSARPAASSVNPRVGQVRANTVVVPIGVDGTVCFFTNVAVDIAVDVNGYMSSGSDLSYTAATPFRLTDTRDARRVEMNLGTGGFPVGAGWTLTVPMAGTRGIPADAKAVSINLTATGASGSGFVTLWPCNTRPTASTLNVAAGAARANSAIVELSPTGTICVYTKVATHIIIDVNGWWS